MNTKPLITTVLLVILLISSGCSDGSRDPGLAQTGTIEDPILVYDATDLDDVRDNLEVHYKQMADIDLTGMTWEPIGTYADPFKGTYNGNGYRISNMHIIIGEQDLANPVGLFGYVESHPLHDVRLYGITLVDAQIIRSGARIFSPDPDPYNGYIGLLAGKVSGTGIEDCTLLNGELDVPNHQWVGGIAGEMAQNSVVERTAVLGLDLTAHRYAGGIVGLLSGSEIAESFVTGTLSASEAYTGVGGEGSHLGGLVGYLNYNGTIHDSYVDGSVTGNAQYVGGLVGRVVQGHDGYTLSDSYFKGPVTVPSDVYDNASGNRYYGGIFGYMDVTQDPQLEDVLYSATFPSSAAAQSSGGGDVSGFDLQSVTDTALRDSASYAGDGALVAWDFTDTWDLDVSINAGYPYLQHNEPPEID